MKRQLTVAVTEVAATAGRGLLPFLEADPQVEKVLGLASRPWQPREEGHRKVACRQADVGGRHGIGSALEGADVVVHIASSRHGHRANVQGSRKVLAAAAAAGARRFIYFSPAGDHGRHEASAEKALLAGLVGMPEMSWVFLRPCPVVGPHAADGASHLLPRALARAAGALVTIGGAAGIRPAVPGPAAPLQFVHELDAGQAIYRAITAERSGVIYDLAGEGTVAPEQVPRLLGLRTLPVPNVVTRTALDVTAKLPYLRPAAGWAHLLRRPLELDSTRARLELGWKPKFTSAEALASTRRALAV